MKLRILSLVVFASTLSLMSCETAELNSALSEETLVVEEASLSAITVESSLTEACALPVTDSLGDAEKSGLLLMREEEKLAGDVYTYFYNMYKYPVFNNISKSEAVHSNAILYLLKGYNLTDPSTGITGQFSTSELQTLYNDLTLKGSTDVIEALKVGAFIEEYDIQDLKEELALTTNASIIRVYSNLLRGSGNHLKAFTRLLKIKGVVYTPQILTQAEYDAYVK